MELKYNLSSLFTRTRRNVIVVLSSVTGASTSRLRPVTICRTRIARCWSARASRTRILAC